jgi:threonine synthase
MPTVLGLRCRECNRQFPDEALHVCDFCFGPLEVAYDYDAIAQVVSRESIEAGPRSMWRYHELLPISEASPVDLGAGFTPLVRAERLGAELGLSDLWIKDDTANPTGSFKDRVVSVALTKARQLGFKVAACASTGNLANSVAAHAARAGMASVVLIPSNLERAKVRRCEPPVRGADQRASGLGVRQRQCPQLLRRGLQDPRLRDCGAARLAGAGPRGGPDRQRFPVDQGRQGVP